MPKILKAVLVVKEILSQQTVNPPIKPKAPSICFDYSESPFPFSAICRSTTMPGSDIDPHPVVCDTDFLFV